METQTQYAFYSTAYVESVLTQPLSKSRKALDFSRFSVLKVLRKSILNNTKANLDKAMSNEDFESHEKFAILQYNSQLLLRD